MTKKKAAKKHDSMEAQAEAEKPVAEIFDPYVGGEADDLEGMAYVQDENTTTKVDTMPPETKEDAELRDLVEDPTPVEEPEDKGEEVAAEESEEGEKAEEVAETEEEEPVLEAEAEEANEEPQIPKHRFDEINEKLTKKDEEIDALRKQVESLVEDKTPEPEPEPYDYASKEKEAMDAILEGDTEKYTRIRNEIRAQEKTDYLREAKKLSSEGDESVRESLTFEEAGADIEQQYPQFAEGTEEYNAEARTELIDLFAGYASMGTMTRAAALRKAADKTARMYGYDKPAEPEAEPDPGKVVETKKVDPKKKASVAKQQPPALKGSAGLDNEGASDFSSMSDEEFEALPESKKRIARGDVL